MNPGRKNGFVVGTAIAPALPHRCGQRHQWKSDESTDSSAEPSDGAAGHQLSPLLAAVEGLDGRSTIGIRQPSGQSFHWSTTYARLNNDRAAQRWYLVTLFLTSLAPLASRPAGRWHGKCAGRQECTNRGDDGCDDDRREPAVPDRKTERRIARLGGTQLARRPIASTGPPPTNVSMSTLAVLWRMIRLETALA